MIAALVKLNHSLALDAPLPTSVLRLGQKLHRLLVLRAVPSYVRLRPTLHTDLGRAFCALTDLFAVLATTDILGSNEFAAAALGTVDSVAGRILVELLVPVLLEGHVKKLFHVLQGNEVCSAALGGHVLRVRGGQCEDSPETRVAHPMTALQLGHLAGGPLIQTYDTIVPDLVST